MYNFIGGNGKSSAQKWLRPAGQEQEQDQEDEYDDYRQYSSRNNGAKIGGPTSTSGPVKIINNQQYSSSSVTNERGVSDAAGNQKTSANSNATNNNNGSNSFITRSKVFEFNIFPKRLALSYTVPTIVIEYLVPKTGKLYHHKIKIRELRVDSDKEKVLKQIKRRHEMYLQKISDKQLLSLIESLQKNVKQNEPIQVKGEIQKSQKNSSNQQQKEQQSDSKKQNVVNPFAKPKSMANSQLSMEEQELCGKLKNQFGDDDDEDDFEDDYYGYDKQKKKQSRIEQDEEDEDYQQDGEDDDYNQDEDQQDDYEEEEENKGRKYNEKERKDDDLDYDYDFEEFTENENNISKPLSQDTSCISNSNNDINIKQQATSQAMKAAIDAKLNKEPIQSKPVPKNTKVEYDDGIEFSDSDEQNVSNDEKQGNKPNIEKEEEESDGQKDFDVDANAIYQHQFSKKSYSHTIKTQQESQYTDEDEQGEEYNNGMDYNDEDDGDDDNEQEEGGDNDDDEEEEFDLDDIENLRLEEQKQPKVNAQSPKKNNFMTNQDPQLNSSETKQSSNDKQKSVVKFEQNLQSKKPEMQIKSSIQQATSAIGGFVAKKNNYFDADEGLDLDNDNEKEGQEEGDEEGDEFKMDFINNKNDGEDDENQDDEDEEDLYQQVKKKLGNIQQKEPQGSEYKKNLTQKKYEIEYYQKNQQQDDIDDEKQPEDLDDEDNEGDDDYGEEEGEGYGEEGDDYDEQEGEGDEDEENDERYDDDYLGDNKYTAQHTTNQNSVGSKNKANLKSQEDQDYAQTSKQKINAQKNMFDDLENELEENLDNLVDYDNLDLNKLSNQELENHKKKMDKKYEQNRKKPGDSDFIYDVRENFEPDESNQWDISQSQDKQDMEVDYDFV